MNCIILGSNSDIAKGLLPLLNADGWSVTGWSRDTTLPTVKWNLVISCLGSVAPVGPWYEEADWKECFESNLFLPIRLLRQLWKTASDGAAICFLTGSNPQQPMFGYAPYNAAKMALNKVCEQLQYETPGENPGIKFFALGPGYMDTKIHKPTHDRGWFNPRIAKGNPNTIEQVYDCLKWCLSQSKEVVGGRNICVSDSYGAALAERLKNNPNLFKLRRVE